MIPTTEQVRAIYIGTDSARSDERAKEFDEWLTSVRSDLISKMNKAIVTSFDTGAVSENVASEIRRHNNFDDNDQDTKDRREGTD